MLMLSYEDFSTRTSTKHEGPMCEVFNSTTAVNKIFLIVLKKDPILVILYGSCLCIIEWCYHTFNYCTVAICSPREINLPTSVRPHICMAGNGQIG